MTVTWLVNASNNCINNAQSGLASNSNMRNTGPGVHHAVDIHSRFVCANDGRPYCDYAPTVRLRPVDDRCRPSRDFIRFIEWQPAVQC